MLNVGKTNSGRGVSIPRWCGDLWPLLPHLLFDQPQLVMLSMVYTYADIILHMFTFKNVHDQPYCVCRVCALQAKNSTISILVNVAMHPNSMV